LVVVGGAPMTGRSGSVMTKLTGALRFGVIFNVLNFENGCGLILLSAYWQSVIRGVFLHRRSHPIQSHSQPTVSSEMKYR
jgi:ribose transport system permease protein